MFVIRERQTPIDPVWYERFLRVDAATVGHFVEDGIMTTAIKRLSGEGKFCGPAVTVRALGPDSTVVHYVQEIAQPGDVLIVDRGGDAERACWGEMVTLGAKHLGVAGAVVDGPVADIDAIRSMGFSICARGVSALTTKLLGWGGEINTPVHCGGVIVHPGDLVLADSDGVLVLKPEQVQSMYEKAIAAQEAEVQTRVKIEQGQRLPRITKAAELIGKKGGREA